MEVHLSQLGGSKALVRGEGRFVVEGGLRLADSCGYGSKRENGRFPVWVAREFANSDIDNV